VLAELARSESHETRDYSTALTPVGLNPPPPTPWGRAAGRSVVGSHTSENVARGGTCVTDRPGSHQAARLWRRIGREKRFEFVYDGVVGPSGILDVGATPMVARAWLDT